MPALGLDFAVDNGPIKRHRVGFSPTLRDGTVVRTGPSPLAWAGMESSPFQLMVSELMQLWWGPLTPPLWAVGSGLEAHTRDQLLLQLTSAKPSLLSRIADMEACDVAFVLEEKIVRSQNRNADAGRFRAQLDSLPYFKKLKSPGTSLGDLQACVALSKLRPGGLLWWAREEPLSEQDGAEVLAFLLDRGKLICEWDLSQLDHQLPVSLPLFPRYLYLFSREGDVETRMSHRPLRISLSGQIRSHIEVPVVLEDMLASVVRQATPRGQWQIHAQTSPSSQKDWASRWPDLACQNVIRVLERLRNASVPLANVSTVRSLPDTALPADYQGIWIQSSAPASSDESGRRLHVRTSQSPDAKAGGEAASDGYLILLPDASWVAPIAAYLKSSTVRDWLDHHAERKGDRWNLNEQVVRWIPDSETSSRGTGHAEHGGSVRAEISPEWVRLISEIGSNGNSSRTILSKLEQLESDESSFSIRASVFVRAAQLLENLETSKKNLLSLVSKSGRLAWVELFNILPKSEFVSITLHSRVSITGNLPLHLPISRIERVKSPAPGILLATEMGMYIQLTSDQSIVLDMLWEQLEHAQHPTWSELVQSLRLPRKIEMAQATAEDVLRSHAEVSSRTQQLRELLSDCSIY